MVADVRWLLLAVVLLLAPRQRGRLADELGEILLERAAAGVRVMVLYDAFGTQGISAPDRAALRDADVQVVPFRPLRRSTLYVLQNRSHVRGFVVDGRVGWTGGFGIDDEWLGDGHTNGAWRDTNVRFEGPAVRQLRSDGCPAQRALDAGSSRGWRGPRPRAQSAMRRLRHSSRAT